MSGRRTVCIRQDIEDGIIDLSHGTLGFSLLDSRVEDEVLEDGYSVSSEWKG